MYFSYYCYSKKTHFAFTPDPYFFLIIKKGYVYVSVGKRSKKFSLS